MQPTLTEFAEEAPENDDFGSSDLEDLIALQLMEHWFKRDELREFRPVFHKSPQDEELYLSAVINFIRFTQRHAEHLVASEGGRALRGIKRLYENLVQLWCHGPGTFLRVC